MAKQIQIGKIEKPKVRRKGVHAKTKMSSIKGSKLYKKKYRGQGKWLNKLNDLSHHQEQAQRVQNVPVCARITRILLSVVMAHWGVKVLGKYNPKYKLIFKYVI